MKTFNEWLQEQNQGEVLEEAKKGLKKKKWIQKALDPEHKGFCTPMTKKTCTPKRKAFALRAKAGEFAKGKKKQAD